MSDRPFQLNKEGIKSITKHKSYDARYIYPSLRIRVKLYEHDEEYVTRKLWVLQGQRNGRDPMHYAISVRRDRSRWSEILIQFSDFTPEACPRIHPDDLKKLAKYRRKVYVRPQSERDVVTYHATRDYGILMTKSKKSLSLCIGCQQITVEHFKRLAEAVLSDAGYDVNITKKQED